MKKSLLLILAIIGISQASKAQTNKGTNNVGLNFGYQHNSTNDNSPNGETSKTSSNAFSIGPSFGHFVADGLELGAGVSYATFSQNSNRQYLGTTYPTGKQDNNSLGASVYLRKYFLLDNKFGFRAGPYAGYNHGTTKYNAGSAASQDVKGTTNDYNIGANLDFVYYPSSRVGLAATFANLGYSHSKYTGDIRPGLKESTTNNFGLNFLNSGLTLNVFFVF